MRASDKGVTARPEPKYMQTLNCRSLLLRQSFSGQGFIDDISNNQRSVVVQKRLVM